MIWCQGFSEPGAGSDLASLRTRADDAGDHFVINGSKIWTSYADFPADWCMLLARTDQKAPKHKGISVFALDMRTRGITVRPIRSMGGPRDFNEVFFDEVVVPRDCLLGNKNEGWMMVVAGLSFERVGVARYAKAAHVIEMLVDYARNTVVDGRPLADRPDVRAKIADLYCRCQAARLLNYRAISMQAKGQVPSIEGSIARVHNTTGGTIRRPGWTRHHRTVRVSSCRATRWRRSTAGSNASGCTRSPPRSRRARSRCKKTSSRSAACRFPSRTEHIRPVHGRSAKNQLRIRGNRPRCGSALEGWSFRMREIKFNLVLPIANYNRARSWAGAPTNWDFYSVSVADHMFTRTTFLNFERTPAQPQMECYTMLAAIAAITRRVRLVPFITPMIVSESGACWPRCFQPSTRSVTEG